GTTARADRADHVAGGVLDHHRAGLGQELALGGGGERDEEVRVALGAIAERAARHAHADRAPRLAARDLEPEHARAVLARERLERAALVEHGDAHRLVAGLARR